MFDWLTPAPADEVRKRLTRLARADGARGRILASERLARPTQQLERTLEIKGLGQLPAFRVRFEQGGNPTKGGVRFAPDASLAEAERLSLLMTLKCALAGLPFGGAKGAVRVEARQLDQDQREEIARAYAHAFADVIGPETDVPAPDIATGPFEMDVIRRTLNADKGRSRAPVTGLPPETGGLALREGATGLGGWRVYQRLCESGHCKAHPRIAVQGFGSAGSAFARAANQAGAVIVAVSDSRSMAANRGGLDIDAVTERKRETGKVGEDGDPGAIVETDCDVLVLAASGDVIDAAAARKLRAERLIELANAPVTRKGYEALDARGIESVPDILANAGGVAASYFEWRAFGEPDAPDESALKAQWKQVMDKAADAVSALASRTGQPVHAAALLFALDQLDPDTRQLAVS
ncbi:Glu/Leu/Phe/Val family dehydrogenase [Alkalicaulis satelles]|nr:Glu/Leu/Phe/Val dehydrogenase [Alkalicaulis satelles]